MSENSKPKVLCVDDEPHILDAIERTLQRRFDIINANTLKEAEAVMESNKDIAVVISDYVLGDAQGLRVLSHAASLVPDASRVLLSGQIDLKSVEDAINSAKIHKFILKPWDNDELLIQIVEAHRIHKRILEQKRLQRLAITDPVTQLTNHRFFQEKLRLEWEKHKEYGRPLSLIMIDIDHFKKFNDRFGHPDGDKLLKLVSNALHESLPAKASLSRYGGEEFALILPSTTSPEALMVAEKLRSAILKVEFHSYPLSISLGVATAPEHAGSVDELLLSSDQSLYQAKRRGRNQTVVGLNFDN